METRADHNVRLIETGDQTHQVGGVVLAVGVHLNERVIAVALSKEEGSSHGTTNAYVERQRCDLRSGFVSELGGRIRGSVVHHQHIGVGDEFTHLIDDLGDGTFFIPRGDRHQDSRTRHASTVVHRRGRIPSCRNGSARCRLEGL